jgi:hypothetical protein
MKQFITILLIGLCLTQITFAAMKQACVDDDAICTFGDFSLSNHSVDDNSAINCPAGNVMGSFGDAGADKCYGIFDGCFGLGNDEQGKVDCGVVGGETLSADCIVNSAADADHANCAIVCADEGTCGTAKDGAGTPVDCCVAKDAAAMRAACVAWKAGLYCDASGVKISLFLVILLAACACVYFGVYGCDGRKTGITSSAGKPTTSGYKQIPLRGRGQRTQF